ncbi:MAG: hypothetical protein AAFQ83_25940 [Bacteroidota bacterium]
MKKLTLFLGLLLSLTLLQAQAPQGINYQAVLRDGNAILANTQVNILLGILDENNNIVYEESQGNITTDAFGLISYTIGEGTPVIGQFDQIDWTDGPYTFLSEATVNGVIYSLGEIELVSVPYSLFSDEAATAITADSALFAVRTDSANYADEAGSAIEAETALFAATAGTADSANQAGTAIFSLVATDMEFNDLTDGNANPTTVGQILRWDGTEWVASTDVIVGDTIVTAQRFDGSSFILANDPAGAFFQGDGPNGSANYRAFATGADVNQGFFGLGDAAGNFRAQLASLNGEGFLSLGAPNGSVNVVANTFTDPDFGAVLVTDDNSFGQGIMDVTTDGEGRFITFGTNGFLNYIQGGVGTDPDLGAMTVFDETGTGRAIVGAGIPGQTSQGFIELYGNNGNVNLTTDGGSVDFGYLALGDTSGDARVVSRVKNSGEGEIVTFGATGTQNVEIGSFGGEPNAGFVIAFDSAAGFTSSAGLFGDLAGKGQVQTTGPNGFANFSAGAAFGNDNQGSALVWDSTGSFQAGIYVDAAGDGIVFGDIKNFRTTHPTQPGKEIWYASMEGPEAGAYVRGTATLVNGEVEVIFPDHFQAIANPQTMTVSLTPLSAESEGLAVIEKTATGFKVKELRQGAGNYSVDWEVKAVRKGYENYQPVRDALTPDLSGQEIRQIMNTNAGKVAPEAPKRQLLPKKQPKRAQMTTALGDDK